MLHKLYLGKKNKECQMAHICTLSIMGWGSTEIVTPSTLNPQVQSAAPHRTVCGGAPL